MLNWLSVPIRMQHWGWHSITCVLEKILSSIKATFRMLRKLRKCKINFKIAWGIIVPSMRWVREGEARRIPESSIKLVSSISSQWGDQCQLPQFPISIRNIRQDRCLHLHKRRHKCRLKCKPRCSHHHPRCNQCSQCSHLHHNSHLHKFKTSKTNSKNLTSDKNRWLPKILS